MYRGEGGRNSRGPSFPVYEAKMQQRNMKNYPANSEEGKKISRSLIFTAATLSALWRTKG